MKYMDKKMDMHNAKITKAYTSELSAVIISFLQKNVILTTIFPPRV